ncbi:glycosyltransferase family 2 protein [Teredinibacter waterburyi]|uniref:glycosyltransferase family 2 protein n=1 Tax=Teredinibacter waterburyi TaxID=1500538 RepID=UPI00165ECAE7|nr:glycosyltransferase [Teredinibacter waterburyi]
MPPLVSVVIPTYNYGHYLRSSVQSVLRQTYNNIEVIIVDDGSTDDTKRVVEEFGDSVIYHYKSNAGLSAARNTGIEIAKGKYIQFLDSDDLLGENSIESRVALLEVDDDAAFVICRNLFFKYTLGKIPIPWLGWKLPDEELFALALSYFNIGPPHALLCRLDVIVDNQLMFDESLMACEDYDFWLKLFKVGGAPKYCNVGRVYYRRHSLSMSKNISRQAHFDSVLAYRVLDMISKGDFPGDSKRYLITNLASSLSIFRELYYLDEGKALGFYNKHIARLVRALDKEADGLVDLHLTAIYRLEIYALVIKCTLKDESISRSDARSLLSLSASETILFRDFIGSNESWFSVVVKTIEFVKYRFLLRLFLLKHRACGL